jgi:polyisoprenyl-phosphate glycosyltransferase
MIGTTRPSNPTVSVVSPVFNEAAGIAVFVERVEQMLREQGVTPEIVLVDDGSGDDSWSVIEDLARRDGHVRGVELSRNFGKEAALMAGLAEVTGDVAIVMDSDLQHPPRVIPDLLTAWRSGADIVEAVKRTRTGQSTAVRWASRAFNAIFRRLTRVDLTDATDYRLLDRDVIEAINAMPERAVFFRGMSTWIGYERKRVHFDVDARAVGTSRWSLRALIRLAVNAVTSFTAAPLHLVTLSGLAFTFFALIIGIQTVIRWVMGDAIEGFTTVILLLLIQGSIVMVGLGIIGEYLARIHDEVKARPRYIVARRTGRPD